MATANVWFADLHWERRADALLAELRVHDPDVIGLQEVMPRFLDRVLADPWVRAGYAVSDPSGTTLGAYGVLLLVRPPAGAFHLARLPTQLGRKLGAGHTEDTDLNLMRLDVRAQRKKVRYDRILLCAPGWRGESIELLGTALVARLGGA